MKFCVKCGKELLDEAIICTNCGCLVDNNYQNKFKKNGNYNAAITKEMKLFHIFNFISNILFITALSLIIIGLSTIDISIWIEENNWGHLAGHHMYNENSLLCIAFCFSILNIAFSIVSIMLYESKCKEKSLDKMLNCIFRLSAASLFTIASLLSYIISINN